VNGLAWESYSIYGLGEYYTLRRRYERGDDVRLRKYVVRRNELFNKRRGEENELRVVFYLRLIPVVKAGQLRKRMFSWNLKSRMLALKSQLMSRNVLPQSVSKPSRI